MHWGLLTSYWSTTDWRSFIFFAFEITWEHRYQEWRKRSNEGQTGCGEWCVHTWLALVSSLFVASNLSFVRWSSIPNQIKTTFRLVKRELGKVSRWRSSKMEKIRRHALLKLLDPLLSIVFPRLQIHHLALHFSELFHRNHSLAQIECRVVVTVNCTVLHFLKINT